MEIGFEDLNALYWVNFIIVGVAAYFFFKGKAKVAAGWLCIAHMVIMVLISLWCDIYISKNPGLFD